MEEPKERTILHCDCNSFFASVELLYLPELRKKPVAVCGNPENRHGIVLAKNEPAKAFGVRTAETVWQAKEKCPDLVVIPPHHGLYEKYSRAVNAVYGRYTDLVEPFSIDESFLDITGSKHLFGGDGKAIADEIRGRVRLETGLTVSAGVSYNKIFAKLGSDYKKPDATTVITRENYKDILWPLPVNNMMYVGRRAEETLTAAGITTIGRLAMVRPETLEKFLGKMGRTLWAYANGLDNDPVRHPDQREEVKSVGNGRTFRRDLTREEEARAALYSLADGVAMRLRGKKLYCTGVQVTIKDAGLKTIQRQGPLPETCLSDDIGAAACALLTNNWAFPRPIRALTVTAINLTAGGGAQLTFFAPEKKNARKEQLESTLFDLRRRYGAGAVGRGSQLDQTLGLSRLGMEEDDVPRDALPDTHEDDPVYDHVLGGPLKE